MELITKLMTQNDCYKTGRKITPKGIMVHSTATPGVMAADWYSRWNKSGVEKAVHAFVDDKGVFQYLPWNHRAWHCGDSGNNTHVAFEICEPKDLSDKEYFEKAYANAVELAAMLCKEFKLTEKDIICHCEGYKLGIASNHADVMHWFPKHGKSMDTFREDVRKALLPKEQPKPQTNTITIGTKVKVKGSKYATRQNIPAWVKKNVYTVIQINGDKALLSNIISWVYIKDLNFEGASQAPQTSAKTGTVTASSLNVRAGAGTNYKAIGGLKSGSKVTIVKTSGDWHTIKFGSGTGYVHKDYIKLG